LTNINEKEENVVYLFTMVILTAPTSDLDLQDPRHRHRTCNGQQGISFFYSMWLDKIDLSMMTETTIDKHMFEHMNLKGIGQVYINGKTIKKALTNHL
jgi:hypothetical protein